MNHEPSAAEAPARHAGPSAVTSVSRFGGCLGAVLLAALAIGGVVVWRTVRAVRDSDVRVGEIAAELAASLGDRAAAASETPRAEVDSGQVMEGDFEIHTLDQVLADGDIERAMEIAIENDPERLRALLEDGTFDPNLKLPGAEGYFALPLEKAVRQGADGTVEILLAAGADPNGRDSSLIGALASASSDGNTALVRRLLAAGADPDLPGQNDQRAIESAAFAGHLDTVEALLAGGADLHFALHAASWSGNLELVRKLVAAGADPKALTQYGDTTVRGAASRGHLMVVETFLRWGAEPGEQALREAAQFGHVDVLRACARAGVSFDTPPAQWDPLYTAAYHGQIESVRVLLELGASPSGYSRDATPPSEFPPTPLEAARAGGHTEIVALLRDGG